MTQQEKEFREGKLLPMLIKFSIPSTISALTIIIYNVTDRYFIGQAVGRNGIGAIAIIFPIILLLNATAMLFSIGGAALAGIKMGREDISGARRVLGTSLFIVIAIGLFYTIFGIVFQIPIIKFMGAGENNIKYAVEYNTYFFPSIIFQLIFNSFCSFVRLEGNPIMSMIINLSSAFANMILDYILVMIIPLGMKGAAIATSISNIIPAVLLIIYFSRSSLLKLERKYIKYNRNILKGILSIGVSAFLNQFFNGLYVYVLNIQLVRYGGEIALAAMGIMSILRNFINTSYVGLNQGRQPILSYNWGARNYKRVKDTFYTSVSITAAASIILVSFIVFKAPFMAGFFVKNDPELITYTTKGIHVHLSMMISTAVYLSCTNYFQAVGKGYITSRFIFLRLILLSIPLAFILPLKFGVFGALLSFPIADTTAGILAMYVMSKEIKNLNYRQSIEDEKKKRGIRR